jgi:YidC/Oxa1 family membrane protein insertase
VLDFIYYPVSFVLWCWHQLLGSLFGDSSAAGWALAIVLLVCTIRMVLLRPAISQVRAMRKMQRFAPEMRAVQREHAGDRQRQAQEMQRLQREHGVNPLAGCLPALLQIPAFLGLSRVLRTFTQYPDRANYFFPHSDVVSYLDAKLFGAHLGDAIFSTAAVAGHSAWLWQVAPVAIPLMVVAAVATHVNARLAANRQLSAGAATAGEQSAALTRTLSTWVFPLGVLVFGAALPVGLLVYWVSNNVWTLGQQYLVLRRLDAEELSGAPAVRAR